MNAMPALLKFLVLLAIFLLASNADAFTSLSPVAGNQIQENQWFQFVESMKLTNKQTGEPTKKSQVANREPKQDAELPRKLTDLTTTQPCGLCHNNKPHESSCASLLVARAKCLNSHESSCASLLVARAKCLNSQKSRCASLLVARAKCLKSHESSCASKVARAKCLNSHESSCASKVACAKCLNSHESSCASLLVAQAKCLNSHESSCASLLVVRAKPLKSNKTQRMTPGLSLKFIGKSILEGAQFAPTTLQAFQLIVASTSIADFQLIVDLFLNLNCEGACADVASATTCNKSIKFIDVLSSEGDFSVPANFENTDSEGARAPSTTFSTLHDRKSKYIVTSHFSKTFLHFSKDFAIFREGDWENVNN
jgi:hypothetical protein